MKKITITVCILCALAVLVVSGIFAYMIFSPPRPSIAVCVLTQKKLAATYLPVGSTNVLTALSGVGLGGRCRLVRLHAPLSNILSYVERRLAPAGMPILTIGPVRAHGSMLQPYGLQHLDWFDVANITTGFVTQGAEYNSMIYVDSGRELYYYSRTD